MILKDSVNSFGGEEVVDAGAVVLVVAAGREADSVTTCLWCRATPVGPLYAEIQGASAAADKRRVIFQRIAINEEEQR